MYFQRHGLLPSLFFSLTQVAAYMVSCPRTPVFSENSSFLRKIGCIPCDFRCEKAQANSLCYTTGNLGYLSSTLSCICGAKSSYLVSNLHSSKNFSSVCNFGGCVNKETIINATDETTTKIAAGIIPMPPTLYPGICQFWRKK